jgi:hypothetical protein
MTRETDWGELKINRHHRLTDTAWTGLAILAKTLDVSKSELLERLGRTVLDEEKLKVLQALLTFILLPTHNDKRNGKTKQSKKRMSTQTAKEAIVSKLALSKRELEEAQLQVNELVDRKTDDQQRQELYSIRYGKAKDFNGQVWGLTFSLRNILLQEALEAGQEVDEEILTAQIEDLLKKAEA